MLRETRTIILKRQQSVDKILKLKFKTLDSTIFLGNTKKNFVEIRMTIGKIRIILNWAFQLLKK